MLKHPNFPSRTAAVPVAEPFFTVNLYKNKIYVYKNVRVGNSRPITLGKKVANYPQDADHLSMIKKLYPNALVYGTQAA